MFLPTSANNKVQYYVIVLLVAVLGEGYGNIYVCTYISINIHIYAGGVCVCIYMYIYTETHILCTYTRKKSHYCFINTATEFWLIVVFTFHVQVF